MIKIVSVALLCAVILLYLKNINSDIFVPCLIVSGLIIFSFSITYLSSALNFINNIVSVLNINDELFTILIKITAIGYIVEFGASTINDFGLKGLADKLVFVGKLAIFTISIPVFYSILSLLKGLLK
jgi:stage III sporulation protein AD